MVKAPSFEKRTARARWAAASHRARVFENYERVAGAGSPRRADRWATLPSGWHDSLTALRCRGRDERIGIDEPPPKS
jgi:hypothetical protein